MTAPPAPMTHDAFYERQADWLRRWMQERLDPAIVPITAPTHYSGDESAFGPEPERRVLTIKRAIGKAPYVGRPFVYEWRIAIDDDGHYVTGEAEQRYTMDDATYQRARRFPGFASVLSAYQWG